VHAITVITVTFSARKERFLSIPFRAQEWLTSFTAKGAGPVQKLARET